jgi:hypothetical protein
LSRCDDVPNIRILLRGGYIITDLAVSLDEAGDVISEP